MNLVPLKIEKVASKLAPNISNLMKTGILKKIISNGQITQVSLPTILTQTYPLDFDGYNNGIRSADLKVS